MTISPPPTGVKFDLFGEPLRCISALDRPNLYRIAGTYPISDDGDIRGDCYLTVPGHGDLVSPKCGEVVLAIKCPNDCHKPSLKRSSCHNLTCTCPSCVKAAIAAKAAAAERRNKAMYQLWKKRKKNLGKLKHFAFSPDVAPSIEEYLADNGRSFRKTVISLIRDHSRYHVYAGQLVVHPFRYQHLDGSPCNDEKCDLGPAGHRWTYSPHAHFLGYGYMERAEIFHKKTGWIYKNIKPGERRSFFATFAYELSHVGFFMREVDKVVDSFTGYSVKAWRILGRCYHNIGLFSDSRGGSEKGVPVEVEASCPKCGSHLLEHPVNYKPTRDPEVFDIEILENVVLGVHMEYEITETWHLNVPRYQISFIDGKIRRLRLPSARIYLDDTYRLEKDDLLLEDADLDF